MLKAIKTPYPLKGGVDKIFFQLQKVWIRSDGRSKEINAPFQGEVGLKMLIYFFS